MHDYTLIRSNRRSMSLEITKSLTITVRAPMFLPLCEIERFVESRAKWIDEHLEKQRQRLSAEPKLTEDGIKKLKDLASEYLPSRTAYFAERMRLFPTGVKISSAKSRFGSCSSKNSICYSWRLMLYPEAAIDYVVVHELAHIKHKNHGKAFYALLGSVLPDYKERRKLLKML